MKNGEHEVSPGTQGMNLLCFYRHFFVGVISFVGMGCYALYFFVHPLPSIIEFSSFLSLHPSPSREGEHLPRS